MTGWLVTLAAAIATIELARRLRLMPAFAALAREGRRAARLIARRRVSEWAKERAMRLLSARLFARSLSAAGRLALAGAPVAAALCYVPMPAGWLSHGLLLAATVGYSLARRAAAGGSERMFQRLTLGSPAVRELSFDLERSVHRALLAGPPPAAPVFVAGLARAGTTILMRALHDTGQFASLTYRDLPLPLAPNLWARATRGVDRSVAARERGHGDGIVHDLDSPEAIEEVFWLNAYGDDYRRRDRLVPAPVPEAARAAFADHVRLVQQRYGRARYLSKNNNNILRLAALAEAFPDAVLIHPFRDPLQQAISLARQHDNACALAANDPARGRFMTWLGHHEFGSDHRPFHFGGDRVSGAPAGIDYWLARWIDAHAYLLAQPEAVTRRQIFVDFDRIAEDRVRLEARLGEAVGAGGTLSLETIGSVPARPARDASDFLLARATRIHAALKARALAALDSRDAVADARSGRGSGA